MTEEEQEEQETPTPAESDSDESKSEDEGGPDAAELDKDPAYNPDDENLKGLKGG